MPDLAIYNLKNLTILQLKEFSNCTKTHSLHKLLHTSWTKNETQYFEKNTISEQLNATVSFMSLASNLLKQ